ncbi:MAG TPA: DsbA family protein, partial [Alphaproteobacteria bacterium]|nr:DsbA family protein [Alphaproteobacteria bacterium]
KVTRFFLAALTALAIFPLTSVNAKAQEFTEAQKAEIKKMFDEYLLESGANILKSVNTYQAKMEEQDRIEAGKKAQGFVEKIENEKNFPMAGNPKGEITLVEFFDYNCGYCHKALEEIQTVIKDEKDVKVLFMDMPILGANSLEAAKWSLAANKQGKYFEFHQAVLSHNGERTEDVLKKIAKDVGLDVDKLMKDKDDEEIAKTLEDNIAQAGEIGIRGTPGFIIGDQLFPGYIPADQMKQVIAEARKK